MTDPEDAIDVSPDKIILELAKLGIQVDIPGLHRTSIRIEKGIARGLYARLTTYVLSEHLADDTQEERVRIPATWWEHAKEAFQRRTGGLRVFSWWFSRHPVRYRTITLSVTWQRAATRPFSKIRFDESLGAAIYQEVVTRDLWES